MKIYQNIKCFKFKNRYFVYFIKHGGLYEINFKIFKFINKIKSKDENEIIILNNNKYHKNYFMDFVKLYNQNKIINIKENNIFLNYPIKNIMLNVSQNCNMKCIYCYGDDGTYGNKKLMPYTIARKSIEFIESQEGLKKDEIINITFFGGEPLLNYEVIYELVEFIRLNKIRAKFGITTNGTLLNDEIIEFLIKNNFSITISFDGPLKIQNRNRPLINGDESYNLVIENIKKIINKNYNFSIRCTLVKGTKINLILDYFKKLGIKNVMYCSAYSNKKEINYSDYDYINLIEQLNRYYKKIKTINDLNFNLIKSEIRDFLNIINFSKLSYYNCGIGKGYASIDVDGNIYSCHRFINNNYFKIGDIFNGFDIDSRKKYFEYDIDKLKICKECWARYICGGTCFYGNHIFNNDIYKINKNECSHKMDIIERAFHIYLMYVCEKEYKPENKQNILEVSNE